MYDDHYGLRGRPFQLTPDPRFWFDSATHKKAMAYLGYGLSQGEGFIVVTGDIGAGKTTLVGHLMASIDRDQLHVIKLVSTQIEADDLLRLVAQGLDVDYAGLVKAQLLDRIERQLHAVARSGRRTLLVVDEAQALAVSALEELRMLSNFQAGGHALLQIFLLGQPEFRERLHGSARLEQLRQRIIAIHHLEPMGRAEIAPYIMHRLQIVGWDGRPSFTPDAFDALFDGSDGVPRRLNQLAGRVLLFGAIEHCETIDAAVVRAVIADIAGDQSLGSGQYGADEPEAEPADESIAEEAQAALFGPPYAPADPEPQGAPAAADEPHVFHAPDTPPPVDDGLSAPVLVPAPLVFHHDDGEAVQPLPIGAALHIVGDESDGRMAASSPAPITTLPPPSDDAEENEHRDHPSEPLDEAPDVAEPIDDMAGPVAVDMPTPSPLPTSSPLDDAFRAQLAALEARVEEQEAALRRVLTLLVDWVESDSQRPDLSTFTGSAA